MILYLALCLIACVFLFLGAEGLVRGSASLALRLGLTPLVVGLTVVAFGTSTPELLVSVQAALDGQGDIALGNVVGSNIFNVGVILGLAAVVCPLPVTFSLIRFDVPVMVGTALLLPLALRAGMHGTTGALLLASLVAYVIVNLRLARRQATAEVLKEFDDSVPKASRSAGRDLAFIAGGLLALVLGAKLLVFASVSLAKAFGVSEAVIGLTIVAAGTSMPELATSVVAAIRKEPDICIGNVVGSNIFNILGILGASALARPFTAAGIGSFDLAVMTGFSVATFILVWTNRRLGRVEGALLLAGYAGYLYALWPK